MEDPLSSDAENLPADVNRELWHAHALPTDARAAAIDEVCSRHPDWAARVPRSWLMMMTVWGYFCR